MKVDYNPHTREYTLSHVSETELQCFEQAFAMGCPFSDVPELYLFSKELRRQLRDAIHSLIERYEG